MTQALPVHDWPSNVSKGHEAARHLLRNPEGDLVCPCCFLVFESREAGTIHVVNKHPAPSGVGVEDEGRTWPDPEDSAIPATLAPRAADTTPAPGATSADPTAVERVVGRAIRAARKARAI